MLDEDSEKLVGVMSMRTLVLAHNDTRLGDVMYTDIITVSPDEDEEEVASDISKYDIVALARRRRKRAYARLGHGRRRARCHRRKHRDRKDHESLDESGSCRCGRRHVLGAVHGGHHAYYGGGLMAAIKKGASYDEVMQAVAEGDQDAIEVASSGGLASSEERGETAKKRHGDSPYS